MRYAVVGETQGTATIPFEVPLKSREKYVVRQAEVFSLYWLCFRLSGKLKAAQSREFSPLTIQGLASQCSTVKILKIW